MYHVLNKGNRVTMFCKFLNSVVYIPVHNRLHINQTTKHKMERLQILIITSDLCFPDTLRFEDRQSV